MGEIREHGMTSLNVPTVSEDDEEDNEDKGGQV